MKQIVLTLALRYLWGAGKEKNISTMIIICFVSLLIGTFSLAIIVSIMNGFEHATHEKLRGIHASLIMRSPGNELNIQDIAPILRKEFPAISAFAPSAYKQVIIQEPTTDDMSHVVMLRAIDPLYEQEMDTLARTIISPADTSTLSTMLAHDQIIIGKKLAQELALNTGDYVTLLYSTQESPEGRKITLEQHKAIIGGIFATGIDEFDSGLVVCSFVFFNRLFPDEGISQINVRLAHSADERKVLTALQQRFSGLHIYSWKELYPALVSALALEKYAMFFILSLIILVASMNVISLLFMQIIQKRADIAILQAMGLSRMQTRTIFTFMGMIIATTASIIGLILAAIACFILERFPFIQLPDTYYVSHLPAKMEWHIFGFIFLFILFISYCSTQFAIARMRKITIIDLLRFEV